MATDIHLINRFFVGPARALSVFALFMDGSHSHPLAEFIYRTFGESFGALLTMGYGEKSPPRRRSFRFDENYEGGVIHWAIDAMSDRPPKNQEPLVLAALLKLLLKQKTPNSSFIFGMGELLEELGWEETTSKRRAADHIIEKYVYLRFVKRERGAGKERYKKADSQWGHYKLISGYSVYREQNEGPSRAGRESYRVDFDGQLVRALAEGRITFADLDFGPMNSDGGAVVG